MSKDLAIPYRDLRLLDPEVCASTRRPGKLAAMCR